MGGGCRAGNREVLSVFCATESTTGFFSCSVQHHCAGLDTTLHTVSCLLTVLGEQMCHSLFFSELYDLLNLSAARSGVLETSIRLDL